MLLTLGGEDTSSFFITTWTSADGQITLPLVGGETYNFNYRVDGGSWTNHTSNSLTISGLPTTGTRTLEIDPINDGLPRLLFNNSGDRLKLESIEQWGSNAYDQVVASFYGCENMVINASDQPNLLSLSNNNLSGMFRNCDSIIDGSNLILEVNTATTCSMFRVFRDCSNMTKSPILKGKFRTVGSAGGGAYQNCTNLREIDATYWDLSNNTNCTLAFFGCNNLSAITGIENWVMTSTTTTQQMFQSCFEWNTDLNDWDTQSLSNISNMFFNATSYDQSFSGWNVSNITNATGFLTGFDISTSNYESTLISWGAQAVQNGVTIDFENSVNSSLDSKNAKAKLIFDNSWTITDGATYDTGEIETFYTGATYIQNTMRAVAGEIHLLSGDTTADSIVIDNTFTIDVGDYLEWEFKHDSIVNNANVIFNNVLTPAGNNLVRTYGSGNTIRLRTNLGNVDNINGLNLDDGGYNKIKIENIDSQVFDLYKNDVYVDSYDFGVTGNTLVLDVINSTLSNNDYRYVDFNGTIFNFNETGNEKFVFSN